MTKIDIISGFLGAGKTTLIKKLLSEALKGEQVVLIENEFGQIGIDGGFLKEAGIEIKEMNSGCICCSLVGDFGASLKEVLEKYHPDRIVIEPSGVGKLSDVVKAVEGVLTEGEVVLNSATAVVDASKCKMYLKNFGEFFANQIEHAQTIVLSRTGQMREEKIEQSLALIREHNKEASVITTPWEQLEGARILEVMESSEDFQNNLLKEMMEKQAHEHHHEHEHHHDHEHDENCTCGGHDHEHDENCTCGCHDHEHEHHHDHEHDENCTCGCHDHDHHENCTCGCHDHSHGHHHADEVFTSWGMETPRKYTEEELKDIMEKLEDKDAYGFVLRAKGIIASDKAEFFYFDYVPGESEIRKGAAEYIGKICVIGSGLQEENLKNLFMA